jgi:hypothetical protein
MKTNHLKKGVELTPETPCVSNTPQTMDKAQHRISAMKQRLSQTLRESGRYCQFSKNKMKCSYAPDWEETSC